MFDSPLSDSAYAVLGVEATADAETLRRAYRAKLRETHPDTGGDAAEFVRVQRAWELIGTTQARAGYDSGHGFGAASTPDFTPDAQSSWRPRTPTADTRPKARTSGHPGGWNREHYLRLMREWAGRGIDLDDPYDPALVRRAPREIQHLLADALAEEATARIVADLGMGYTVWHDLAVEARGQAMKIDHIVLGPSGLYAIASEDTGGPVRLRRGEIEDAGDPIGTLVLAARTIARAAKVRFSGVLVVLPDEDLDPPIVELGKSRGMLVAAVTRSALSTVLRRGITGARDIGGNEIFDLRTRLQQVLRFA